MKLKQNQCAKKKVQAFDVAKLKQPEVEEAFSIKITNEVTQEQIGLLRKN